MRQVGFVRALQHGTARLIRGIRRIRSPSQAESDPFDLKYGTDTAQKVGAGALDIPDAKLEDANAYQAVSSDVFFAMMEELRIQYERFVFIDLGSGKGRALLLASRFPFKEIIGVELSAFLTGIAINNLRIFKDEHQKCHKLRAMCLDATSYELPPEMAVLFLYNPFGENVMRSVVSNVECSLRSCPRKVYVLYDWPLHQVVWDRSTAFQIVKTSERYRVYESKCP
jgi:SAM-dependent methyltransferase